MPTILPNLRGCTSRVILTLAHRIVILGVVIGVMIGMRGPQETPSPGPFPVTQGRGVTRPADTHHVSVLTYGLRIHTAKGLYSGKALRVPAPNSLASDDLITLDETHVVMLDGTGPALLSYEAEGGEVVTIIARTLEPDSGDWQARNVVLDVLSPDGRRLAYNDNHFGLDDDLLPTDAAIEKLVLPERGVYTIRVNTYGGIFPGAVEISLLAADLYEAAFREADGLLSITALLPQNGRYAYTFEGSAGDVLRVTARDTADSLDPVLRLVDEAGVLVAFNDDHGTASTALDVFDALLDGVTLPADGRYTLIVTDFLGRAGAFELVIEWR